MPETAPRRVAVAGGGTAGHVLAGVAIATAYRKHFGAETYFTGCASGFESRLAPARGEELTLIRGLPYARQSTFKKLLAMWKVIPGILDARRLLRERRTEVLVGVGGYPSISAAIAAKSLRIPVVVHEANAGPGLANRLVGLIADFVCTGFEETIDSFHDCPAEFTGSPAGTDLRGLVKKPNHATVLVTGGSEGSPFLNREIPRLFAALKHPALKVWHLAGQGNVEPVRRAYKEAGVKARVDAFIDNIEEAYAESCFVIACPGALTLAEIAQAALPSLLVPLSTAANDHQAANARSFCARTGAAWVSERDWDTGKQVAWLRPRLSTSSESRTALAEAGRQALAWARPDAAAHVARVCEEVVTAPARAPEPVLRKRWLFGGALLAAFAGFLLRVLPTLDNVFTPAGITFQEFDPWFHARTVQNLLAHFPWRSGFDPYMIFPGGQNNPTGPFWDYLIATVAWICGAGSPSFTTAERVAVTLPAVMGALLTLPVFWLIRRLFNDLAGLFAAWWIAVIPGTLLWTGHLGMADHHIAETTFAFFTLGAVAAAVEARGWRAALLTAVGGMSLGAYLATRPAGIFVVGILVTAAVIEPVLARIAAFVLMVGALLFLPISGVQWSGETWIALGAGISLTLGTALVELASRRGGWSKLRLTATLFAGAAVILVLAWSGRPAFFNFLLFQVKRTFVSSKEFGGAVQEVSPLLRVGGRTIWQALTYSLGYSWILAFPALIVVAVAAKRRRRPALTLFAIWSAVMAVGAFAQLRMAVYFEVNAAMLSGIASGWLVEASPRPLLRRSGAAFAALLLLANLPIALRQMSFDFSPDPAWRYALEWLRLKTPEPFGDPRAWNDLHPALPDDAVFTYPPSAYSVLVWWDFGYWVEYLGRRIPSSNGTQNGAKETARFFTETDPVRAMWDLDALRSRYVIIEPSLGLDSSGNSRLPAIIEWSGKPVSHYVEAYWYRGGVSLFFKPAFYQLMATRLLQFEGRAVGPGRGISTETWVIHTQVQKLPRGRNVQMIDSAVKFASEEEARASLGGNPAPGFVLGGFRGDVSCVALDAVAGLRLAYANESIKIFQRVK